jgi:serine/threonine-protein kinase
MANSIINIGGYTIIKRLGTGARSTIYLARDEDGKEIALKRVVFERAEDSRIFDQVETEYKVANDIDNPYVRKCYALKKIRRMMRVREMILSMELFEGTTLEDSPSLSLVDVLLVFRMVASGMGAMHRQGYVHCDMKPNNILMNKTGAIKIIDLGQSCRIGTVKQRIQGTPDYIAPEQVQRKPLGPKTDIFNLGATMYWALTGNNIPTMIPKKEGLGLSMPPERKSVSELKNQIPTSISDIVMECVRDDSVERPASMQNVVARLDEVVRGILGDKMKTIKNVAN